MSLLDRFGDRTGALLGRATERCGLFSDHRDVTDACGCTATFREPTGTGVDDRVVLDIDAGDCRRGGALAADPACRATVVRALTDRDADVVRVVDAGRERAYLDRSAALLLAAGRFRDRVAVHDGRLADLAATDPLRAAHEATGRAGAVARAAAETGLAETAAAADGYDDALRPHVAPTIGTARVATRPPPNAALADRWETSTGATVRLYDGDGPLRRYHLDPPEAAFDVDALATLAAARDRLLAGEPGGDRAASRAVRAAADGDTGEVPIDELARALRRHTGGYGVLEDVFADDRVSDAFLTPPVAETPLRVVVDGERLRTNVRMPPAGAATLASRLRRDSGRGFSRATPTLDATLETAGGPIRVAATTNPASDGLGFAFRRGDAAAWTLPRLVDVGTLTAPAAGLLSVAVERGVAGLVAGGRGAGKTSTLGALVWELGPGTRTVLVEDTPELPAARLRAVGRDVLRLSVGDGPELAPQEAVRTALRLGDGALVVGEVRGSEAAALYEAMRVGAGGDTVLGTIHGADANAVRERVVSDLGVRATSFASTDVLVTLVDHRVREITEVAEGRDGVVFHRLFERARDGLVATGRIDRGNSALLADLAAPEETYADVRAVARKRATAIGRLARLGRTGPRAVADAVANR